MADVKVPVFASDGSSKGEMSLDADVFGIEPNMAVLHQVVTAQLAAKRSGTASTKTRAEVRGGGAKPWRQKGLGRARHGSSRSPIWIGGGVAHGPKPRDYSQRTPKKMKKLALRSALSARVSESALFVIDSIDWTEPKTKQAKAFLTTVGATKKALIVLSRTDVIAAKSFRNLTNVTLMEPSRLTAYDILLADRVIFTSHTVGVVGSGGNYGVTDSDFVKESDSEGGEG